MARSCSIAGSSPGFVLWTEARLFVRSGMSVTLPSWRGYFLADYLGDSILAPFSLRKPDG